MWKVFQLSLLAFTAGYVDANSLQRFAVFITGMSGNSNGFSIDVVGLNGVGAGFIAFLYSSFVIGTAIGHAILTSELPHKTLTIAVLSAMSIMFAEIIYDTAGTQYGYFWGLGLVAFGMASHNELANQMCGVPASLFITGHTQTVTKSVMDAFCTCDKEKERSVALGSAALSASAVISFISGGICSSAWVTNTSNSGACSLSLPAAVMLIEGILVTILERREHRAAHSLKGEEPGRLESDRLNPPESSGRRYR